MFEEVNLIIIDSTIKFPHSSPYTSFTLFHSCCYVPLCIPHYVSFMLSLYAAMFPYTSPTMFHSCCHCMLLCSPIHPPLCFIHAVIICCYVPLYIPHYVSFMLSLYAAMFPYAPPTMFHSCCHYMLLCSPIHPPLCFIHAVIICCYVPLYIPHYVSFMLSLYAAMFPYTSPTMFHSCCHYMLLCSPIRPPLCFIHAVIICCYVSLYFPHYVSFMLSLYAAMFPYTSPTMFHSFCHYMLVCSPIHPPLCFIHAVIICCYIPLYISYYVSFMLSLYAAVFTYTSPSMFPSCCHYMLLCLPIHPPLCFIHAVIICCNVRLSLLAVPCVVC